MPIDYRRYPANWKSQIRPSILKRADYRCEFCGLRNYSVGYREDGVFKPACGNLYLDCIGDGLRENGASLTYKEARDAATELTFNEWDDGEKYIVIVLTIAHLDHDLKNNDPENLKALCQKCHLDYDQQHHAINAAKTRRRKQPIKDMFD